MTDFEPKKPYTYEDFIECTNCGEVKENRDGEFILRRKGECVYILRRCRECRSEERKARRRRLRQRTMNERAPIDALIKLVEQHPQVLADLAHRWRHLYEPLLEKERKKLSLETKARMMAHTEIDRRYRQLEQSYGIK